MFKECRFNAAKKNILLALPQRNRKILNYIEINSVVFLADVTTGEQIALMESYAQTLKDQFNIKNNTRIVFLSDQKQENKVKNCNYIFHRKQTDFWSGCIKQAFLRDLKNIKADLLVDFSSSGSVAVKSMVAVIPAICKVAIYQENWQKLYDFCIEVPEHKGIEFVKELNYFLSHINQKQ
jgi:hypothetical protein